MGKASKEHRAKVLKRNLKTKQEKSGMQKAFDLLMEEQIKKMGEKDVKVEAGGEELNFEIVQDKYVEHAFKFTPNEEESAKITKEFEGNVAFKESQPDLMMSEKFEITEEEQK